MCYPRCMRLVHMRVHPGFQAAVQRACAKAILKHAQRTSLIVRNAHADLVCPLYRSDRKNSFETQGGKEIRPPPEMRREQWEFVLRFTKRMVSH